MALSELDLFQRNNEFIEQNFNTKDDYKYTTAENLILDMSLSQFKETFFDEGAAFGMSKYLSEVPEFYDVEAEKWNETKSMFKINFKIKIDGVPFYNSTTADADFYIDSWD